MRGFTKFNDLIMQMILQWSDRNTGFTLHYKRNMTQITEASFLGLLNKGFASGSLGDVALSFHHFSFRHCEPTSRTRVHSRSRGDGGGSHPEQ